MYLATITYDMHKIHLKIFYKIFDVSKKKHNKISFKIFSTYHFYFQLFFKNLIKTDKFAVPMRCKYIYNKCNTH